MNDAVIVSAVRTPVGKAKRGGLATVRPDEMAAAVIQELLKRTPNLDPARIEDVVIGCRGGVLSNRREQRGVGVALVRDEVAVQREHRRRC